MFGRAGLAEEVPPPSIEKGAALPRRARPSSTQAGPATILRTATPYTTTQHTLPVVEVGPTRDALNGATRQTAPYKTGSASAWNCGSFLIFL